MTKADLEDYNKRLEKENYALRRILLDVKEVVSYVAELDRQDMFENSDYNRGNNQRTLGYFGHCKRTPSRRTLFTLSELQNPNRRTARVYHH